MHKYSTIAGFRCQCEGSEPCPSRELVLGSCTRIRHRITPLLVSLDERCHEEENLRVTPASPVSPEDCRDLFWKEESDGIRFGSSGLWP